MSMIDPKGSRPSALVNFLRLQQSGNLKLIKNEAYGDSDKRISPTNDGHVTDTTGA